MDCQKIKFTQSILILFMLFFLYGCTEDSNDSEMIITSSDCPIENIVMRENTQVTYPIESHWSLSTTIRVECKGRLVNNAQLKINLWWPFGEYKVTTDENGEAKITEHGQGSDPVGKKILVTIIGENNQEMTKTFIID